MAAMYMAACAWMAPAAMGQASAVSAVDENGKRVFINAPPKGDIRGTRPQGRVQTVAYRTNSPAGTSVVAFSKEELQLLARDTAERYQVDPALVHAIIEVESDWDPQAISSKGAQGLMQLMPATAQELGVRDPFDPQQNIEGGVRYLRALLERYDGDLEKALAAYNAGGGTVDRAGGVPNYRETRDYVRKITDTYFRPGSGRLGSWWRTSRGIYQVVEAGGKRIFSNE